MLTRSYQRQANQFRPIQIIRNYTKYSPGSVLISFGDTKVLVTATIDEKVPRHVQQTKEENAGWLTAEYAMLPSATQSRNQRERVKVSGRTNEIQRLIGRSLRASIDLSRLGPRTITIDADVIQADGGTRVASITGGYVAMVDALIHLQNQGLLPTEDLPIISPVAAISVGIVDGVVLLDLDYDEDSQAEVDSNIVMNGNGQFIELQATSERLPFDRAVFDEMLDSAKAGIEQLISLQQSAFEKVGAVL